MCPNERIGSVLVPNLPAEQDFDATAVTTGEKLVKLAVPITVSVLVEVNLKGEGEDEPITAFRGEVSEISPLVDEAVVVLEDVPRPVSTLSSPSDESDESPVNGTERIWDAR